MREYIAEVNPEGIGHFGHLLFFDPDLGIVIFFEKK